MDELTNPFRPGAGTRPPALLGRDLLIDRFGLSVRRAMAGRPGKSVIPIGLRGVGKTVLLIRFVEFADVEGLAVGCFDAPETGELRVLLANRLRKVLLGYDRGSVSAKVLRALRVLKTFTLQLPDGSRLLLDVDALVGQADSGNLADDVTDLLVAAGEAAADRGSGLVLAVDEIQYLDRDELAAIVTAIHRTTQLNLPVVLIGAGLPQLPALAGEAKSYAERLFEFPSIGSLSPDDSRAALTIPACEQGVEITDDALDQIVAAARGYPYFLQEWGYHVWNAAERSPIDGDVVAGVYDQVVGYLDENFFRVRFDRLAPAERRYLRAMAELGPGPHRSGDVAAQLGVKVESVAPRRSGLIAKGMVYSPGHGDTAFTVPLFDEFLRRALPVAVPA
jgi:hypothetical protein